MTNALVHQPCCTICASDDLAEVLSFGSQPLSTRFHTVPREARNELTHALSTGYCKACGAIQLIERFPIEALQSKFPPIRFREPKDHLNAVAEKLTQLEGINTSSRFLGLSYIDEDIFPPLVKRGYDKTVSIDYSSFHGWQESAGLETIQSLLSDEKVIAELKALIGTVDVVCARFILEHAESAYRFLHSLTELVRPGGYIVVEVPDVEKMIAAENHALIWEDHFTYFNENSLMDLSIRVGAAVIDISRFPYAYEDALVAMMRVDPKDGTALSPTQQTHAELHSFLQFAEAFVNKKARLRAKLEGLIRKGERLAVFGAGHHAAKYINFYGLEDLFEFVVDDNPSKRGLYMPGTSLLIRSSEYLVESPITICILTLGPDTELRLRTSMKTFFDRGGEFIRAFHDKETDRAH